MKKRLTAIILAAVMTLSAAVTAFAGAWQYYDGSWYFSDEDEDDFLTGWQWIDGYCYYLNPDEYGAMAVSTVTPDGFPVNDVGRMTDTLGEPYYIPGWGLTATTLGPADYPDGYVIPGTYYTDPYGTYPLSYIFDLDFLNDLRRRRGRENDRGRKDTPDTVIVVVGGQQPNVAGQPDMAGQPDVAGQPDKAGQPETAGEESAESEEQTQDNVIRSGRGTEQSETDADQTKKNHTQRPMLPESGQEESGKETASDLPEQRHENMGMPWNQGK